MTSLKYFGMWMWEEDQIVSPKESEWFGVQDETGKLVMLRD